MSHNYRDVNTALPSLLNLALTHGRKVDSRNGETVELMNHQFTLSNPARYEVFAPGRKASLPAAIAETMWILAGRNDIEWLSHYLPRAAEFSDNGKTWRGGYGPRIRKWDGGPEDLGETVDQLAHVVDLLKRDALTRRAVINLYNPKFDSADGKDIPCNNWLHFLYRDNALHLHVVARSNDIMWGWSGINAFEWTVLLNVVANLTGLERGTITFSVSSLHLYDRHYDKATRIAQAGRSVSPFQHEPLASPQFKFGGTLGQFDAVVEDWFTIEALIRDDERRELPVTLNRINDFEEPMMRSWLWALYYWHKGQPERIGERGYAQTALQAALLESPKFKAPEVPAAAPDVPKVAKDFTRFAADLHADKHRVYGGSWKKRGEMLSIMANIARKIDRLGDAGGGDTAADTAVDLLVYLIKYDLWLAETQAKPGQYSVSLTEGDNHVNLVTDQLRNLERHAHKWQVTGAQFLINELKERFETLYHEVEEKRVDRQQSVQHMMEPAYLLALCLWQAEEEQKGYLSHGIPQRWVLPAEPEKPVFAGVVHQAEDSLSFTPVDLSQHQQALRDAALLHAAPGMKLYKPTAEQAEANATRHWNPEQEEDDEQ